ncbi:MAG: stage III sporulation protein AF [Clostridia bacterium]|nr:stage III sporulation protein AF [Clostridia bacterium]
MNGYLLSVIGTVLLSAILTAIVPNGKTASVVKAVTKLACLLVIVSPILGYIRSGTSDSQTNSQTNFSQSVIQTDESFIKYYSEMRIRDTETQLEREIEEEFSLTCAVTLAWEYGEEGEEYDTENIRVTQITARVENGISEKEKTDVWEYLTKNYCSEVLIE